jgi:hypothetical protein
MLDMLGNSKPNHDEDESRYLCPFLYVREAADGNIGDYG